MIIDEKLFDTLLKNVNGWERRALLEVAKRIGEIGKLTSTQVKQINNIAKVRASLNSVYSDLADMTKKNISEIVGMYESALDTLPEMHRAELDYRGITLPPIAENERAKAIVNEWAKVTAKQMINISQTSAIGISLDGKTVVPFQKALYTAIDRATVEVVSGAGDFYGAMRGVIKSMGGSGIQVMYGSGVHRRIDSVVRMNLLSSMKGAFIAYDKYIGEICDCDGIEIDWHANPRPSHEFMQGQQYCDGNGREISGKWFNGSEDTFSPVSGLNVLESLDEPNCRHFPTTIICGISVPNFSKEELDKLNAEQAQPIEIDGKTKSKYDWTQVMRYLEREMRTDQYNEMMLNRAGDVTEANKMAQKYEANKAMYEKVAAAIGAKPDLNRINIAETK